ncbi:phosphatase PAP2 family protein [Prevotella falsenii]|uniref:phosphatase PAP2 family protein n=1 Tax=Prevotella falsenii TaxID=515414 RepID=UPI0004689DDA|nr:phosphatase PAP2 family protein [Prevotella falsenii]
MLLVCLCCRAKAYSSFNDTVKHVYSRSLTDSLCADVDTGIVLQKVGNTLERISNTRFHKIVYSSAPLIVNGLIVRGQNKHFRGLRNDYLPEFNRHLDNYTQYLPAAVMLGLKLGGVEGRSSWGRMLASDALTVAVMASIVNTLKHTTHVERPDGTDHHSYPSGHTATAFMTATMLNKEYGHKSPWIGIGAYTVASATGLMRMANNKHWLSDVLTGAGIGILSTELGYYFADLIFKNRGLNNVNENETFDKMLNPSFLSLNFQISLPLGSYPIGQDSEFKVSSGCTSAVEGAYFFNPYVGVGGRFSVSRTSVIVDKIKAEDDVFDAWKISAGAYFSYPLSERWLVGSKLLAEHVQYPDLQLTDYLIDAQHGFGFGTGLSLTFRARQRYGIRFLLDYDLLPYRTQGNRTCIHSLTLGSAFLITF